MYHLCCEFSSIDNREGGTGEPGERVVMETVGAGGDIKYRRDDYGVHHFPKRSLEELILGKGTDAKQLARAFDVFRIFP